MKPDDIDLKITEQHEFYLDVPKSAGEFIIGGNFHVSVNKKPNSFQLLMTRWLLGWKWVDSTS